MSALGQKRTWPAQIEPISDPEPLGRKAAWLPKVVIAD